MSRHKYLSARLNGTSVPYHAYATHQRILVKEALAVPSGGVIVETGVGFYSTPLLSEIASARDIALYSYVEDLEWARFFEEMTTLIPVKFSEFPPDPKRCNLALIDHEWEDELSERTAVLQAVLDVADVVIAHDAEHLRLSEHGISGQVMNELKPWTAVFRASNHEH